MFLILLGIFSVAFVSSLMKIFPPPYAKLIGVLGGLFLTTAMFYTGVVDTGINIAGHAGLWALALLALVIILSLTSFMSKGKGSNGSLIIILIVAVILYLLFSGTISASNVLWDYLFFLMLILALLALLWFLASGAGGPGGAGGGRIGWPNMGWLGAPFKWLGNALKGAAGLAGKGIKKAGEKAAEIIERRGSVTVIINSPKAGEVFERDKPIIIDADIAGGKGRYISTIYLDGYKIYDRVPSGANLSVRIGTPDEINLANGTRYLEVDTYDIRFAEIPAHMRVRVPIEIVGSTVKERKALPANAESVNKHIKKLKEELRVVGDTLGGTAYSFGTELNRSYKRLSKEYRVKIGTLELIWKLRKTALLLRYSVRGRDPGSPIWENFDTISRLFSKLYEEYYDISKGKISNINLDKMKVALSTELERMGELLKRASNVSIIPIKEISMKRLDDLIKERNQA